MSEVLTSRKPKRKNSIQRKEKSRDAARCRRSQETKIFSDLVLHLPLASASVSQLDKASVIRVCIAHIKLRGLLANIDHVVDDVQQKISLQCCKSCDGFLLLVSLQGDIIYVTKTVESFLGILQVDILGQNIFEFIHPCDHEDFRELLYVKSQPLSDAVNDPRQGFCVRMKCALTNKGRNINVKSTGYKVITMSGKLFQRDDVEDANTTYIVLVGQPIADLVNSELALDEWTFVSRLTMDLRFLYCDDQVLNLLGYSMSDLVDQPLFKFHHASDAESLDKTYRSMFVKGQVKTDIYRFLAKSGGYVWMETQAAIIGETESDRLRSVVCINHLISGIECEDQIFADVQLKHAQSCDDCTGEEAIVIEDDEDEIIIYEYENNEDKKLSFNGGMQLVTERLLGFKALPHSVNNGNSVHKSPAAVTDEQQLELQNLQPEYETILDALDDLDSVMEMRAPYIPMDDDMSFISPQPLVVLDDQSVISSLVDLDSDSINSCEMNASMNGYNTKVTQSSPVSTSVAETVFTTFATRQLDNKPVVLKIVLPLPSQQPCKSDTSIEKASSTSYQPADSENSSSVLMNLLTNGVDYNFGYRLGKPVLVETNHSSIAKSV